MMKMPSNSAKTEPRAGAHADWNLALYIANVSDAERVVAGIDLRVHVAPSFFATNGK
jgi:hypothetical protein